MGRPPKETDQNRDHLATMKKQARIDEVDRIPIEGKFGQAKRRFSLGRIMAKLSATGECAIAITFLVMNLEKWQRQLLFWLLSQKCVFEKALNNHVMLLNNICVPSDSKHSNQDIDVNIFLC